MRRFALALLLLASAEALAAGCEPAALRAELAARRDADQSARHAVIADPNDKAAYARAVRVDAENTAWMRDVITQCGWPKQSVVGEDGAQSAWLLAQHADMDPEFQSWAANRMKQAVLAGEASGNGLALLVDRNRRLNDLPQVYGMQSYKTPTGTVRFYDIVNPAELDARRKAIGLASFHCHALDVSKRNGGAAIEWPAGVPKSPDACPTNDD